jgi:hypothetical protein
MMVYSEIRALRRRSRRLRRGVLLSVALPCLALAQIIDDVEEPEEEIEEIRRYTVEMIVFEYANSGISGSEIFVPEELPLDEELLLLLPRSYGDPGTIVDPNVPVAIDAAEFDVEEELEFLLPEETEEPELEQFLEEVPSHILQTRLEVLDPEVYAMKDIYEKLVELDAYRPIMRAAWTQATFEKDQTLPIRLRRIGNAPLRLDGNLILYLSRYLHLVVDLTIESEQERSSDQIDDNVRYYGDRRSSTRYDYGREPETTKIKYTISEDRIFRNGELRYYDHPKFGVLARITRFEEEELETDEMFLLPPEAEVSDTP